MNYDYYCYYITYQEGRCISFVSTYVHLLIYLNSLMKRNSYFPLQSEAQRSNMLM